MKHYVDCQRLHIRTVLLAFFVVASLVLSAGLLPVGTVSAEEVADGAADLAVVSFGFGDETEVKPGTALTFSVTVKNEGTVATDAPIKVTFGTVGQQFAETTHSGSIAPGETAVITADPWKAVAGDYMAAVRVNSDEAVAESSYINNTMQTNLRVADAKLTSAYPTTEKMLKEAGLTKLIFNDDFDSIDTVDVNDTAKEGCKWYVDRAYGESTLTPADYTVKDGVMTVHNINTLYNYGLATLHCDSHAGFTYNTGYMEVRVRIPRPRPNTEDENGVPAIWALPPDRLYKTQWEWVEIDWMEYWGDDNYTIALHDQRRNSTQDHWYRNSNPSQTGLGDGEWHVMGWLWQEGIFIAYYDGKEVMRQTYAEGEFADPIQDVVQGEFVEGTFTGLDEQQMPIIIGGSEDNPMELDYVRVWDGNDDYVPVGDFVMSAEEFVAAYTVDAAGTPITTVDESNYQQILAGEMEWELMETADRNKVVLALLGNEQPVYLVLLEQAKELKATLDAQATQTTTTTAAQNAGGAPQDGGDGVSPWLIAAIAAGVLVLAAVIVLVVRLTKKKPTEQAEPEAEAEETKQEEE